VLGIAATHNHQSSTSFVYLNNPKLRLEDEGEPNLCTIAQDADLAAVPRILRTHAEVKFSLPREVRVSPTTLHNRVYKLMLFLKPLFLIDGFRKLMNPLLTELNTM
jgi:hypothetical protein